MEDPYAPFSSLRSLAFSALRSLVIKAEAEAVRNAEAVRKAEAAHRAKCVAFGMG